MGSERRDEGIRRRLGVGSGSEEQHEGEWTGSKKWGMTVGWKYWSDQEEQRVSGWRGKREKKAILSQYPHQGSASSLTINQPSVVWQVVHEWQEGWFIWGHLDVCDGKSSLRLKSSPPSCRSWGPALESISSAFSQVSCSSVKPPHWILNWNQFQNHQESKYFSITQKSSSLTLTGGAGFAWFGIVLGVASDRTLTWNTSWIFHWAGSSSW